MIETGKLRLEINHLHEPTTDISTRRTAQVEQLEKQAPSQRETAGAREAV